MSSFWTRCAGAALAAAVGSVVAGAQTAPITLSVDLTDAPRKILHATEVMPVTAGPLTVVYPKWIPGEHGPTGPIENMSGFFITANGQPVKWERDKVDMFAYHGILSRWFDERKSRAAELEHAAGLPRWDKCKRGNVHAFHNDTRRMEVRNRA
jgi:hypothetical protein